MSIQDHPRWLELNDGNIVVPISLYEALSYSQSYENIGGHSQIRTLDGTGLKQRNWGKIRTAVSGNGGIPIGLSGLDFSDSLVLKCGAPRLINSPSNVVVVPNERRIDAPYLPYAYKRVEGALMPAEHLLAGNTLTITIDPEADLYGAAYYPEIEVLMNNPSEGFDWGGNDTSWSFTAEQR